MKVRVSFIDAALTLAAVNTRPGLLERLLFGSVEADRIAASVGERWVWDSTGRAITSPRVVAALERERRRAETE